MLLGITAVFIMLTGLSALEVAKGGSCFVYLPPVLLFLVGLICNFLLYRASSARKIIALITLFGYLIGGFWACWLFFPYSLGGIFLLILLLIYVFIGADAPLVGSPSKVSTGNGENIKGEEKWRY